MIAGRIPAHSVRDGAGGVRRRLTTVMFIDMVGSSRLMAVNEIATIETLHHLRDQVITPGIEEAQGRIVKSTGDGYLVEFPSTLGAVEASIGIQRALVAGAQDADPQDRIWFRIGINIGEVTEDQNDLLGEGVHLAAFLESRAPPGGIAISRAALEQVRGKIDAPLIEMGPQRGKGLPEPVEAWQIDIGAAPAGPKNRSSRTTERPSIAVLPFQNMAADPEQQFLVDGIVQDVITGLSRFHWLTVIAWNSTQTYAGRQADVRTVGRELGVRYVVTGSVRRGGDRMRVLASVIDAESGATVWANRWDSVVEDIFDVQDQMTEAIVTGIAPELSAHERTIARKKPTDSLTAWELCQRGDPNQVHGGPKEYFEARQCLKMAMEADPEFCLPYALMSRYHSYALMVVRYKDKQDSIDKGVQLAEKAISLDDRNDEGHISLALMLPFAERYDRAMEAVEQAILLNPNNPTHRHYRGWLKLAQPDAGLDGIIADVNDAIRLSPTDHRFWQFHFLRGMARVMLEDEARYDAALADFQKSMEGPLCDWMPYLFAAMIHEMRGAAELAERHVRVALAWHPELTVPKLIDVQHAVLRPRYAELLATLTKHGLPAE